MAHFAELDQSGVVLRVIVLDNDRLLDDQGVESEATGAAFCRSLFGEDTIWLQTSYNTYANQHSAGGVPFRKNYAGIGYTYDAARDAFIPPMPEGDGWTLDEDTCVWVSAQVEQDVQPAE